MTPDLFINTVLSIFYSFLREWWWFFAPIILFFALWSLWGNYIHSKYAQSQEWALLEIKIPKLILKTPKAMENIFSSLHAISTGVSWVDANFKGKVQNSISFEVIGAGGSLHFYIRTLRQFRNFVESQIYSQYSDAEIHEVKDYCMTVPNTIPDNDYDLWGAEMKLAKEDAYPVRTYEHFEEMVEERRTDPISSLTEFLAKLKPGEQIWIQYVLSPASDSWKEDGVKLVNRLLGKVEEKKPVSVLKILLDIFLGIITVLSAPSSEAPKSKKDDKKDKSHIAHMSPGEREIVKEIEENIAKLGFHVAIRFMYVAQKEMFYSHNMAGVVGFFKQFNTLDMNGFAINSASVTAAGLVLKKTRTFMKKRGMYSKYVHRVASNHFVLNVEELATIFHFPSSATFSPLLPKIEAKRGEPPAGLPLI